jgi:hypothetical protein
MHHIAGLFRERDRALQAVDELNAAGFGPEAVSVIASPTSAGDLAEAAAREAPRPEGGFEDLGSRIGGQADPAFAAAERRTFEERVAKGDTLVRVVVQASSTVRRVEEILLRHGAERVDPGVIRD